jgi:hypothetical protein
MCVVEFRLEGRRPSYIVAEDMLSDYDSDDYGSDDYDSDDATEDSVTTPPAKVSRRDSKATPECLTFRF